MKGIKADKFYGSSLSARHVEYHSRIEKWAVSSLKDPERMPQRLLGPPQIRKTFAKQADALDFAGKASTNDMLCTFAYQKEDGHRVFKVAHPTVYWWYDEKKPPEKRCSYEVIPAGAPCHLYFDLEFQVNSNPGKCGVRMTETLIDIFCAYLLKHWGFPCSRRNVVNLDSTTDVKFSRHLIFRIRNAAFKDAAHTGRFVKSVCADIASYLQVNEERINQSHILSQFDKTDIEELFIYEDGERRKLFVDLGVYTRNRHFRIYKSTKWGKNAHLNEAPNSEYTPVVEYKDRELGIFLDSLIAYFPNKESLVLLEFDEYNAVNASRSSTQTLSQSKCSHEVYRASPFPILDEFILNLVCPGKIRDSMYFESTKTVLYEITGNRYCANIGRPHRSNNVFWIVHLNNKVAYQKCHDVECAGFKSAPRRLPEELCFHLDEENDMILSCLPVPEEESAGTGPAVIWDDDSMDLELAKVELDLNASFQT